MSLNRFSAIARVAYVGMGAYTAWDEFKFHGQHLPPPPHARAYDKPALVFCSALVGATWPVRYITFRVAFDWDARCAEAAREEA